MIEIVRLYSNQFFEFIVMKLNSVCQIEKPDIKDSNRT